VVRGLWIVALLAALLCGCGDGADPKPAASRPSSSAATPAPAAPAAPAAPVLVELIQQRPGALLDEITVRTDGSGLFDRPSGGVGRVQRDVEVDPSAVRTLRADLRRAPHRLPRGRGRLAPNGATYIVRFDGRTVVARQGREPAPLRRSIRLLAAMLIGEHVRALDEKLGGVAGTTHMAKPHTVVFFQRQGLAGATLDTITVRSDGTAKHDMRHGGAGGRFREYILREGELAKIRRALAKLPRGDSLGAGPRGGAQYLMRYGSRTLTGSAGGISPRAKPAVKLLEGLLDGSGVARTTRENQTHSR
jgi:hypothetical protein